MRKILTIILTILIFFPGISYSREKGGAEENQYTNLKLVNSIGHDLLDSNNLPAKIEFKVAKEDHINAYANIKGEVYVYDGLIKFVESDDELAAVIAHEIAHIVNRHTHKQTFLHIIFIPVKKAVTYISDKLWVSKLVELAGMASLMKVSRNDEHEADITGVDLMMNTDYHPLAMISVLNKISENRLDILSTHPSGDKRLVYVYDYISCNYPEIAKKPYDSESYEEFMIYMNKVIEQRKTDPEKMEKALKRQEKLKKKKLERLEHMKKQNSPWEYPAKLLGT